MRRLVPLMFLAVSGCSGLELRQPPQGCVTPPPEKQSAAPRVSHAIAQPYGATLLKLEDGRFTRPISSIDTIDRFRSNLSAAARRRQGTVASVSGPELLQITELGSTSAKQVEYAAMLSEAVRATSMTGVEVTSTLISIEQMLDELLNRANSMISSQLFAMRSHVAATISDINVVLRDRMQDAYDNLNAQQRQALDRAALLAAEAQAALTKLEEDGELAAADLLCQTTVNFANYPNTLVGLGLPFERCFSPDILCLSPPKVRDVGTPLAEQVLQFRGINLLPNGEYADATLLLSGKETKLPTAGGKSVLQLPLPGGLNGKAGDMTFRGPLMARVDFSWPMNQVARRWFFELKPFIVRNIEVTFGFEIEGPVRSIREQVCSVSADGGSVGSREEFSTCTIVPDGTDKSIEFCEEGSPTSANGDAGITGRLFTSGACTWNLRAKSKAWWGAGAWYVFTGRAHQIAKERIAGPSFVGSKVLNQNEKTWVIDYPESLVPKEYRIIEGRHRYNVVITDNEGNTIVLTEARPSDPKFGSALVVGKRLTINVP